MEEAGYGLLGATLVVIVHAPQLEHKVNDSGKVLHEVMARRQDAHDALHAIQRLRERDAARHRSGAGLFLKLR